MWLVIGLVIGLGLVALAIWLHSHKIRTSWYEWVLAVLGLFLMLFSLQNYLASVAAFEPKAPSCFL